MKKSLFIPFVAFQILVAQEIRTTGDIVKAMHDRYAGKWYSTLTFSQKTTQYLPDTTTKVSTWYECFSFPGTMRIDIDSSGGSGIIINHDTVYSFRDGKLVATRPFIHPLLLLGFDVYAQSVEQTLAKLYALHYDTTVVHEDVWQGRPVYVVGAAEGNLHSSQFWIDKERLYFVRLIEPSGRNKSQITETQFNKYEPLGQGWISLEVIFKVDGKVATTEEYYDQKANPQLDPKLFAPQYWTTATWR